MKKFIVKSISDLITNSSSEVFCVITHPDKDILESIHTDLYEIFDCWRQEYEMTPYLNDFDKDWDVQIKMELPYNKDNYVDFYKLGIEGYLNNHYKDFEIKWRDGI